MGQIPDWCVRLQDSDQDVRANAAEALSLLGPEAALAAVELVAACADHEVVREYAVAALEGMGAPLEESIAGLMGLLSHQDSLVLYWAVTLLGRVRESRDEIEKAVAIVARDSSDLAVRQRAVWALGNMRPLLPATKSMLQVLRASEDPRLARLATCVLDSP
jgi:HEAT repeat protein